MKQLLGKFVTSPWKGRGYKWCGSTCESARNGSWARVPFGFFPDAEPAQAHDGTKVSANAKRRRLGGGHHRGGASRGCTRVHWLSPRPHPWLQTGCSYRCSYRCLGETTSPPSSSERACFTACFTCRPLPSGPSAPWLEFGFGLGPGLGLGFGFGFGFGLGIGF